MSNLHSGKHLLGQTINSKAKQIGTGVAMAKISPPSPDSMIKVEVTMPVRLWWKLMETAQRKKMKLNYMMFNILASAAGFDGDKESYDLLLREIEENLNKS